MIRIDDERGYMWRASSILSFPEFVGKWWKSDAGTLRKKVPASLFLATVG